jgi:dihydrofolate reductase
VGTGDDDRRRRSTVPKLTFDISMSLDGFIAGPDMTPDKGLGEGGERLHRWAFETAGFRKGHGRSGGVDNPSSAVIEEMLTASGAVIMGRRMFGGGDGPWGDPAWGPTPWEGWWGDEPPFHSPVFVLTHHPRETLVKGETTFTFVTDGIESALRQARDAAGGRDVALGGGANVAQQYLRAGLLDEVQIHLVPVLLGRGVPLFANLEPKQVGLECTRVIEAPDVTHLRYRVVR